MVKDKLTIFLFRFIKCHFATFNNLNFLIYHLEMNDGVRLRKVFSSFKLETNLSLLKFPDDFCYFSLKLTNCLEMVWVTFFSNCKSRATSRKFSCWLIWKNFSRTDADDTQKKDFFTDFQLLACVWIHCHFNCLNWPRQTRELRIVNISI